MHLTSCKPSSGRGRPSSDEWYFGAWHVYLDLEFSRRCLQPTNHAGFAVCHGQAGIILSWNECCESLKGS
jgi:hypothetical protein